MRHLHRLGILVFVQKRIERHEDLYTVCMRVSHHLREVLQTITCRLPSTIRRRTNIDSIRARLHSGFRYFFVASRREEAKRYSTMPAVTLTVIECFVPYWGISIH